MLQPAGGAEGPERGHYFWLEEESLTSLGSQAGVSQEEKQKKSQLFWTGPRALAFSPPQGECSQERAGLVPSSCLLSQAPQTNPRELGSAGFTQDLFLSLEPRLWAASGVRTEGKPATTINKLCKLLTWAPHGDADNFRS